MVLTILSIRFLVSKIKRKSLENSPAKMESATPQKPTLATSHPFAQRRFLPSLLFSGIFISLFLGVLFVGKEKIKEAFSPYKNDISRLSLSSATGTTVDNKEIYNAIIPDFTFGINESILPVEEQYIDEWEGLQAYFNKKKELFIHWSTESNYPTDNFEIEKGRVLGEYEVFGKIESIRNPGMSRFFSFVDSTIQKGSTFYRIKKIKPNGDSTFSKILQVHIP